MMLTRRPSMGAEVSRSQSTPPRRPIGTPQNEVLSTPSREASPSPGTWRHPRLDEIKRRQRLRHFDEQNIRRILVSLLMLIATVITGSYIKRLAYTIAALLNFPIRPSMVLNLLRFLIICNILLAVRPLTLKKDDLSDIPLTPSQRKLLGLDPSSAPPPSETEVITPPRYRRSSATPRTSANGSPIATPGAFRSSSGSFSSSPLSGRASPTPGFVATQSSQTPSYTPSRSRSQRRESGSPFSPSASPLFQKALGVGVTMGGGLGGNRDGSRRHSYGSPSRFDNVSFGKNETDDKAGSGYRVLGSPSPGGNGSKGAAGVGLSYKWLYEKTRDGAVIGAY